MTTSRATAILSAAAVLVGALVAAVPGSTAGAAAAGADLSVTRVGAAPATVTAGGLTTLRVTVANQGRRRVPASALGLALSVDQTRGPGDVSLGSSVPVPRIAPGRTAVVTARVRVPATVPAGAEMHLIACADARHGIAETDEHDNCRATAGVARVLGAPSSVALVEQAAADGSLDPGTAAVYAMRAAYGLPGPPAAYRGTDPGRLDSGGVEATVADGWSDYSAATRDELDPYFSPPVYAGARWAPGPATARRQGGQTCDPDPSGDHRDLVADGWGTVDTEHFRFWYYTLHDLAPHGSAAEGINDAPLASRRVAEQAAAIAEHVYAEETAVLGRAPLSDAGQPCNGGDGRIDVYALKNSMVAGAQAVPYPSGTVAGPGWLWISPRFAPTAQDVRDVFAHEFSHLVQMAFRYASPNGSAAYHWLEEATGNWAVDHVYPGDQFEQQFAPSYLWEYGFNDSLDQTGGYGVGTLNHDNGYEDYLFLQFLTRHFDDPSIMAAIWAGTESHGSVAAVDAAIPGGFAAVWPLFAADTVNVRDQDDFRRWDKLTTGLRTDGSTQPLVDLKLSGRKPAVVPLPRRGDRWLDGLALGYYTLVVGDDAIRSLTFKDVGWSVDDGEDQADPDHLKVLAFLELADGSSRVEDWTGRDEVTLCRDRASEDVTRLHLIYANGGLDDVWEKVDSTWNYPEATARVVVSRGLCQAPAHYAAQGAGTVEVDGVTETWSATFTLDRQYADTGSAYYVAAEGSRMSWSIAGTNTGSGCTITGSGSPTVNAGLQLYDTEGLLEYDFSLWTGFLDQAPVTTACPGHPPEAGDMRPLNFIEPASTDSQPIESGQRAFSGQRTYDTDEGQAHVSWSWTLTPSG